jgi:hypothetical protein
MKKSNYSLFVLVILLFIGIIFGSCKKGENDPAISFKSRDARITAKWKLAKIESTETDLIGGNTMNITITYDGTNYLKVTTMTGQPTETIIAAGTYVMTIGKNGYLLWEENYSDGIITDVQSRTGSWNWTVNDKNKSTVSIDAGNHYIKGGTWKIDRLATKELWLRKTGNSSFNSNTASWEGTWYFEKD